MTRPEVPIPRTAVVPAAGLGTRFLPATKTVPKELLPVVDTPGIELVAAEAAEAGAERLVIVTSEGKDGVVAHFVEDLVLEGTLEARGKHVMLEKVRRATALIKVESVVQAEPLGLGHAVGCVESCPDGRRGRDRGAAARRPGAAHRGAGDDVEGPCQARRLGAVRDRGARRRDQRIRRLRCRDRRRRQQPERARGQRHGREAEGRGCAVAVRRGRSLRARPRDLRRAASGFRAGRAARSS